MDPLTIFGLIVGVVSLGYAYKTNRDKARWEQLLQKSFDRLHASVDNAKANTKLAYDHLDGIRRFVQELAPSPERSAVLDEIAWLHGDVTSAERLLKAARADLDSVRHGLFDTAKRESVPQLRSLADSAPPQLLKPAAHENP
jgi:hypothetical protein